MSRFAKLLSANAANAASSSSSEPVEYGSVSSVQAKPSAITVDGMFVREVPPKGPVADDKPKLVLVLPLGVHMLPAKAPEVEVCDPANDLQSYDPPRYMPIYERATADGSAVRVLVRQVTMGRKVPSKYMAEPSPTLLTNGVEVLASMFTNRGVTVPKEPFSFVRIFNFQLTCGVAKRGSDSFRNVDALDTSAFAALNAAPAWLRLTLGFNFTRQHLPQFLPLATQLRGWTNKDLRTRTDLPMAPLPLPMFAVGVNDEWQYGQTAGGQTVPVLPEVGVPAEPPSAFMITEVHSVGGGLFYKGDGSQTKDQARLSFSLRLTQTAAPRSTHSTAGMRDKMLLSNLTLWGEHFKYLGLAYPPHIETFLRYNKVPFNGLVHLDVAKTFAEDKNSRGPEERKGWEDGIARCEWVLPPAWQTPEYLERRGIPVTRALVRARFGNKDAVRPPIEQLPADYKTLMETLKMENPYAAEDALATLGLVTFDQAMQELPDADDTSVRYYCAPAFPMAEPLPMAPRADGFLPTEPAASLPLAVNLTPEEGDAFVLRQLKAANPAFPEPTDKAFMAACYQKDVFKTPYFFFFAVRPKRVSLAAATPAFALTAPVLDTSEASKGLPHSTEELLTRLLTPATVPAAVVPAAPATPATAAITDVNKRAFDVAFPAEGDADARSPKAPRLLTEEEEAAVAAASTMDFDA